MSIELPNEGNDFSLNNLDRRAWQTGGQNVNALGSRFGCSNRPLKGRVGSLWHDHRDSSQVWKNRNSFFSIFFLRHDANVSAVGVFREKSVSRMNESAGNERFFLSLFPPSFLFISTSVDGDLQHHSKSNNFSCLTCDPNCFHPPPQSLHSFNLSTCAPTSFYLDNWYTSLMQPPPPPVDIPHKLVWISSARSNVLSWH